MRFDVRHKQPKLLSRTVPLQAVAAMADYCNVVRCVAEGIVDTVDSRRLVVRLSSCRVELDATGTAMCLVGNIVNRQSEFEAPALRTGLDCLVPNTLTVTESPPSFRNPLHVRDVVKVFGPVFRTPAIDTFSASSLPSVTVGNMPVLAWLARVVRPRFLYQRLLPCFR